MKNDAVVPHVPAQCNSFGEISSKGLFYEDNPLIHPLPSLLLQLSLISIITRVMQILLKPFGQPLIVSQILGGVILGSSVLGRNGAFLTEVFPIKDGGILDTLSIFGFMLFIFLVGVKINPVMVLKLSRKALIVGFLGYFVSFGLANFTLFLLERFISLDKEISKVLPQVVIMQSMTAFPVIACFLTEFKILNSEIGRLVSSSSIICDICHWSMMGLRYAAKFAKDQSLLASLGSFFSTALFVGFLAFVVHPAALWATKNTPQEKPVKEIYIFVVLIAIMSCGFVGEVIGLSGIFACFLLGLVIPDGPPFGAAIVERLDSFVSVMLMPLFFTICGVETNFFSIKKLKHVGVLQTIVLVAFIGKTVGTMLPLLLYRMPLRDAISLALIMNSKGIVELALLIEFKHAQVITEECYAILIISMVVITGVISPLVKLIYDPSRRWIAYRRRTILHSTLKDELRILVCIQKKENVSGIFTLLQISNPTRESHINLVVLHLVKLIGQASSFLIRHTNRDDEDNALPNLTLSEQIFNAFKQLEQKNQESLSIQCYKGVSPFASMHNDVCSLAVEKRTTLIILPYHKQWTFGRRVESSYAQRLLNSNVLKSTPCSVGILIDRGNMNNNSRILVDVPSPYRVAMLFFGGPDDREALAYARRISGHPNVTLVIIRFVSSSSCEIVAGSERSKTLDSKITSDMRLNIHSQCGRVSYTEVEVNDGIDVVGVIGPMGSMYDLIMVGRRHGDSQVMFQLKKWVNECGGIGAVGQVLASSDFQGEASVLIVQQQKRLWGLRDPEESTHLRRIGSQEVSSFGS
ncbi:unnamed protein product [Cuscuta epithymum]|uniref:Cation/H+ exchanger domain-containing protein n=1 Tax=Cuscuta epithymum TaxID=186058 RepID=A0AAV0F1I6_9ASTE|nr:unnamed protein product [Cuscuta epithymum]